MAHDYGRHPSMSDSPSRRSVGSRGTPWLAEQRSREEHREAPMPRAGDQPDRPDIVVRAENLSKTYGHVRALDDVSLEVRTGEVLAVVGDNGAGKSTLMNILSGALLPDGGSVHVAGSRMTLGSIDAARELGIATVYQDLALAPDLTIAQNAFLSREIRRRGILGRLGFTDNKAMASRVAEAMHSLGVDIASVQKPVRDLSGGQRQVVALARAVMSAQQMIIMDEPTAALGAKQSQIVLDTIASAKERGLTILLVSHDLPRVIDAADRIAVMRLGRLATIVSGGAITVPRLVSLMLGELETEPTS